MHKISIIGVAGIPANYGGFETLAENLVTFCYKNKYDFLFTVFCSSKKYKNKMRNYNGAKLIYININSNGIFSILYDSYCIFLSIFSSQNTILLLGVSGGIFLPFFRIFSNSIVISNVDGIEWRRTKWSFLAKNYLKFSEFLVVKFSHIIVSDNKAIYNYLLKSYNKTSTLIPYGGDQSDLILAKDCPELKLPENYALSLCRVEPENNIDLILEAFSSHSSLPIVFIGNWFNSSYGKNIYSKYSNMNNIFLIQPIYDLAVLKNIRSKAKLYVHGHSAGGTNPSLVEMMYFGTPIFAYDCLFNRFTTHNFAEFFSNYAQLLELLKKFDFEPNVNCDNLKSIARKYYTWNVVGAQYFELFLSQ